MCSTVQALVEVESLRDVVHHSHGLGASRLGLLDGGSLGLLLPLLLGLLPAAGWRQMWRAGPAC